MEKTPSLMKTQNLSRTPRPVPKKMKASSATENKEMNGKRISLRRARFDVQDSTDAICTPSRTTRSMANMVSNEMPPPMLPYVTPSKRRTTASTKSSAKNGKSTGEKPKKGRKSKKVVFASAESSEIDEEDLPSVSFLGVTETDVGQFVQHDVVSKTPQHEVESGGDGLAPESQLDTNRLSGQFVRSRKSMKANDSHVESNEDDVLSVSMLSTIGQTRKSLAFETNINSTPLNKRKSVSAHSRSSILNDESTEPNSVQSETSNRMSGQFVLVRKSNQMESNEDETNVQSSPIKINVKQTEEAIPSIVVTNASMISIDNMKMEKSANKRISVIDLTDSPMIQQNTSVLNKTFSPVKEPNKMEEKEEEEEAKDRTFTEENDIKSSINDKTFSPAPTPIAAKIKPLASSTTRRSLMKSTGKMKPQQLKRLQATPFSKTAGLNASLSSAKKAKLKEAITEFAEKPTLKALNTLKVPEVVINSPVFKFGDASNKRVFRFDLVSSSLKANEPLSNGKFSLKTINCLSFDYESVSILMYFHLFSVKSNVKPVPNFRGMHKNLFGKSESIDETRNRYNQRAKLLLSGKKPAKISVKTQGRPLNIFVNISNI